MNAEQLEEVAAMRTLTRMGWGADNPAFRQMFTTQFMPDATKEQADSFNELQRQSASAACAVRYLEAVSDINVVGLLEQVRAPTLVLHVRDDVRVPIELGRRMAAGIPGARFVAMPGTQSHPAGWRPGDGPVLGGSAPVPELSRGTSTRRSSMPRSACRQAAMSQAGSWASR